MTAAISGPGAFSQRTDAPGQPIRDLPNPDYGEQTAFRDQQKAAPLAAADGGPAPSEAQAMSAPASSPEPMPSSQPLPPLFGPSQRPDEPITAGAPMGPGPNQIGPGPNGRTPYPISSQLQEYAAGDSTGALAWLANTLAGMGQ